MWEILLKAAPKILEKLATKSYDIEQLTHWELMRVFLSNPQNPQLLYARSSLSEEAIKAKSHEFLISSKATPGYYSRTKDGWLVAAAARAPLTLRESMSFWMGPELQPHLYLLLTGESEEVRHLFVGCRYTDNSKLNLGDWFGRASLDRANQLINSLAPIGIVYSVNLGNVHLVP